MARLSRIFSEINTHEEKKSKYYAKHLLESLSLNENKKFSTEIVQENLFSQAMDYSTKEEALQFLNNVGKQLDEGFTDFVKKAASSVVDGAKKIVKKVVGAVADAWSGPHVAAIKNWNVAINKIANKYENIEESKKPLLDSDYLIEETKTPNEEETQETDKIASDTTPEKNSEVAVEKSPENPEDQKDKTPNEETETTPEEEPIKDNITFLKKLLKISGVMDDDDGFYKRIGVEPTKVFGTAGNFFKFGAKHQHDFIAMLRNLSHKSQTFKPMTDKEAYAVFANMTLLLSTIKAKRLTPPDEDTTLFISNFIKPALKYTYKMNEVIDRETLEFDAEPEAEKTPINPVIPAGEKGGTTPQDTATTTTEPDTALIAKFTKENPTFVKKLKDMTDTDKEILIKSLEANNVMVKDIDTIVTNTDFLENGINIGEKVKYVKTLQSAGLDTTKISSVIQYIVTEKIEDTFHTNATLMDIKGVAAAINAGGIITLADKIFDNTKL